MPSNFILKLKKSLSYNSSKVYPLEEFVPGRIWVKWIPFRFFGLEIGVRMTVVRFSYDNLWIHSPTFLDASTQAQLKSLGEVFFVVSPNNLHHYFMGDYADIYPKARLYAPPGLAEKRKDIQFQYFLTDKPEDEWMDHIDQHIIMGQPKLREVVFLHKESKTLILGDLLMCFDHHAASMTQFVTKKFGIFDRPISPLEHKTSSSNRSLFKHSIEHILEWDFDKIILSHGRIITENAKETFKKSFDWLFEEKSKGGGLAEYLKQRDQNTEN